MGDIAAALRAILPAGVGLGSCASNQTAPLWPGEEIGPVVPKRLAEFVAGRTAARRALQDAGLPLAAVPIQPSRAPLWPVGVRGSISHCAGACVAIVGQSAMWAGLGVDLEPAIGLSSALWPEILRPEELAALEKLSQAEQAAFALRIFVAKEAAYKAQYPSSEQVFDFHALRVVLTGEAFTAQFVVTVPPFQTGHILHGKYAVAGGFVAACCTIAA